VIFNELCGEAGDVCEKIVGDGFPNFRYRYETQSAYKEGGGALGSLAVPS